MGAMLASFCWFANKGGAVRKKIDRINAYFPLLAGQAFVDLWRGPRRYNTFLLDDKRWKRLVIAMNAVGGKFYVAAPQNHCKVIWRRVRGE
jgi:hypothetical protein